MSINKPFLLTRGLLALAAIALFSPHSFCASQDTPDRITARPPFVQELDLSKGKPALHKLGAFGVGNGRVFALIGLGIPQNTLTNIVGPKYEKQEEIQFQPISMKLMRENPSTGESEEIPFTHSLLYRRPESTMIVCTEKNDSIVLSTVTYAPPATTSILRVVTVRNLTAKPIENLALVVEAEKNGEKAEIFQEHNLASILDGRRMVLGFLFGAKPSASPGRLKLPIGTITAGWQDSFIFQVTFQNEIEPFPASAEPLNVPKLAILDTTHAAWHDWYDGALSVTSSDPRLRGLFENTFALIKTQTDENSGAISPMAKYSRTWCRDGFGPIRLLLASGKFEEVRKFLAYYDYATRLEGFRNSYALDLDITKAPEKVDWDSMTPQQGDDPNLLILQYHHYYRATGDAAFIREHYGFLRRNLTGQLHTGYRLPFHGDETYQVFVMMAEGAPMKDFYSADTGFEYAVAARALSEMAAAIGEEADSADFAARAEKCREKTEEYYWNAEAGYYIPYVRKDTLEPSESPFANINLNPLWIAYAPPGDERQRENVIATAKKLMNKTGTMKSHARTAYYTGMTPGMLLYNLKAIGAMKIADRAYGAMMNRVISPTGEFAEAYDSKDNWINYGSAPTVYRPWESAINAEAVLYYITGLTYDHRANLATFQPHLPPGVDSLAIDNLYAGRNRFSLRVNKTNKGTLEIEIKNTGGSLVDVQLITEPLPGIEPPEAAEIFESPAYRRALLRQTRKLQPGERLRAFGGLPENGGGN